MRLLEATAFLPEPRPRAVAGSRSSLQARSHAGLQLPFPSRPGIEPGAFVVEPRPLAVVGSYRTLEALNRAALSSD